MRPPGGHYAGRALYCQIAKSPTTTAAAATIQVPPGVSAPDATSAALTELLARRIRLAEAAGRHKSQGGDELFDLGREAAVVRSAAELATEHGLNAESVREVFWRIVKMARAASSTARMREHSAIDLDDLASPSPFCVS